jgi:hypothetical protein
MLVDDRNNVMLGGNPYAYSASLDDVERYLTDEIGPAGERTPMASFAVCPRPLRSRQLFVGPDTPGGQHVIKVWSR